MTIPVATSAPRRCDLWKPVIAAVHGLTCGGAFYMLGEVEFIIAAEDTTFFDPHVTYGMTAAFEPIQMLSKMPFHEIMRLSLLGAHERMSVERAREVGLVSEVCPGDELRERAAWAARVIADSPPLVIQGTMRAIWTALEVGRTQGIDVANLFTNIGSDAAAFKAGPGPVLLGPAGGVAEAVAGARNLRAFRHDNGGLVAWSRCTT